MEAKGGECEADPVGIRKGGGMEGGALGVIGDVADVASKGDSKASADRAAVDCGYDWSRNCAQREESIVKLEHF